MGWRCLQSLLAQARRESPGFDAGLRLRMFRAARRPQLLAHVAGLEHPRRWRACAACKGSGGGDGPGRCEECLGDGFDITASVGP